MRWKKVTCCVCGKTFKSNQAYSLKDKKYFCSKSCFLSIPNNKNLVDRSFKQSTQKKYNNSSLKMDYYTMNKNDPQKRADEIRKAKFYKTNRYMCVLNAINCMLINFEKELKKENML